MDLNVNIKVDLSDRTANLLRRLTPEDIPAATCNCTAADMDLKTFIKETVVEFLEGLKKHAQPEENSGKAEEPAPQAPAEPAPQAPAEPAPAPAPEKTSGSEEITDAALRKAVKAAKDKVGGQSVKDLFGEFGIRNSSECPQERRSDLLARLDKLAA